MILNLSKKRPSVSISISLYYNKLSAFQLMKQFNWWMISCDLIIVLKIMWTRFGLFNKWGGWIRSYPAICCFAARLFHGARIRSRVVLGTWIWVVSRHGRPAAIGLLRYFLFTECSLQQECVGSVKWCNRFFKSEAMVMMSGWLIWWLWPPLDRDSHIQFGSYVWLLLLILLFPAHL